MKIVIDIPKEMFQTVKDGNWCGNHIIGEAIRNGIPLPKGHSFIAICDNDYPLSEEVIDDLKSMVFVGDTDDSGKVTYCFTMEEIIEGSEANDNTI